MIGWLLGEDSSVSNVVFAVSILIGGYELFIKGLKSLASFNYNMNTMMTIAIIGATAIRVWLERATVVLLYAISEALESYSMEKARQSIRSQMNVAPKEATIRRGEKELQVSVDDIQIGDIMLGKPGQKIAMDGMVLKGSSALNQAAITNCLWEETGENGFIGDWHSWLLVALVPLLSPRR